MNDNLSKNFSAEPELIPNAKTAKILRKCLSDARAGRNMSPTFSTAKDAIAYLKSLKK